MTKQASNPSNESEESQSALTENEQQSSSYNQGLTPLEPAHKTVTRIAIILMVLPLVLVLSGVALLVQNEAGFPATPIIIPVVLFGLFLILTLPHRKYRRWGYDMGAEQLRVLRGFMWRSDTIVPFNRIQHIDVAQGPLQRIYKLSSLVVHTAGTHNSIVILPGLKIADAEAMRETIKGHIRKDMI